MSYDKLETKMKRVEVANGIYTVGRRVSSVSAGNERTGGVQIQTETTIDSE